MNEREVIMTVLCRLATQSVKPTFSDQADLMVEELRSNGYEIRKPLVRAVLDKPLSAWIEAYLSG